MCTQRAAKGRCNMGFRYSVVLSTQVSSFDAVAFTGDFEANVADIAQMGYDGVELAIRDPRLVNADAIQRVVGAHGLGVPAIGTGQAWVEERLSFTDPDPDIRHRAVERVKSHLPLAKELGAVVIIGLLRGIVRPGVSQEQAESWLVGALRECAEEASRLGVRFALEPINRYETTLVNNVAQGLELVDKVGSESFGLLLDTFHMNIEEPSIEDSIRAAGDRIFHFHVADSNRWYPGAGHLDFGAILRALADTGYQGYVSGEFLPLPDARTAAMKGIEHLKSVEASIFVTE